MLAANQIVKSHDRLCMFLKGKIVSGTLGISVVFLQLGLNYWASFQTLALLILIFLLGVKGFTIKSLTSILLVLLSFGFFSLY